MAKEIRLEPDGSLMIGKRRLKIPEHFSDRQIHSFQTLLEPIPPTPSGPGLSAQQRRKQHDYLMRRALAAVIPGLPLKTVQRLPMRAVRSIHDWIAKHRPELVGEVETVVD